MKKLVVTLLVLGIVAFGVAVWAWVMLNKSVNESDETLVLYVYPEDSPKSVKGRLSASMAWDWLTWAGYGVRTGRYEIAPGEPLWGVYRRLRGGAQSPMRLVVPEVRTKMVGAPAFVRRWRSQTQISVVPLIL